MDHQLRMELLAMQDEDQRVLRELVESGESGRTEYHPRMKAVHVKHNARMKEILQQYGWPGFSLVGQEGAKAAWLLVQHAVLDIPLMKSASLLLHEAVKEGEAERWWLAYLKDKILVILNKPQIYGSQHDFDENGVAYPLPIATPKMVEALRQAVGLGPLSEATRKIQEKYRPLPETVK